MRTQNKPLPEGKNFKVGDDVLYFSAILDNGRRIGKKVTKITQAPFRSGSGDYVCFVEDVKGFVSVENVFLINL